MGHIVMSVLAWGSLWERGTASLWIVRWVVLNVRVRSLTVFNVMGSYICMGQSAIKNALNLHTLMLPH
jgi:hypothetical protein